MATITRKECAECGTPMPTDGRILCPADSEHIGAVEVEYVPRQGAVSVEQLYAAASLVAAAKDFRDLGVRPGAIEEFIVRSDLNPVTSDESLAYGIVIGVLAAKLRF